MGGDDGGWSLRLHGTCGIRVRQPLHRERQPLCPDPVLGRTVERLAEGILRKGFLDAVASSAWPPLYPSGKRRRLLTSWSCRATRTPAALSAESGGGVGKPLSDTRNESQRWRCCKTPTPPGATRSCRIEEASAHFAEPPTTRPSPSKTAVLRKPREPEQGHFGVHCSLLMDPSPPSA